MMKTSRTFLTLVLVILFSIVLSGCGGPTGAASSWPGLSGASETVYVAYNTHVYAVNPASGTEIWRFPQEADNSITFFAPPVLANDQLLVGGYNNILYSLNPANGQMNWAFADATGRYIASPLATEERIYAPSADGKLYALDYNGVRQWTFTTGDALWATPAINGDRLYLPSMDHNLYAIDPQTGAEVWRTEDLGGAMVGTPALGDGVLYQGTFGGELLAIDMASGQVQQRFSTQGWVWAGPTLTEDGRLYFGDLNGYFYALNAADLSQIWSIQPETGESRAISDRPLIVNDTILIASRSGNLYAVDAANGNQRWNQLIGGQLHGTPVQVGETIVVATQGAEPLVSALDSNGNRRWTYQPAR